MHPAVSLLAPLALLLPGAAGVESAHELPPPPTAVRGHDGGPPRMTAEPGPVRRGIMTEEPFQSIAQSFRPPSGEQVRIEQRMTIRISPRPPVVMPQMLDELPSAGAGPRFAERKMGKCVPIGAIAGVQPGGANRLILFLRDQRIVSATLEKACRSRDFYSGFYVARNGDGLLCTDRDQLQSRAGANCQVSGLRQLIEIDD